MRTIFEDVCEDLGGYPQPTKPTLPDKRAKGRAWRLTNRVTTALAGTEPQDINGVTVYPIGYGEETQ